MLGSDVIDTNVREGSGNNRSLAPGCGCLHQNLFHAERLADVHTSSIRHKPKLRDLVMGNLHHSENSWWRGRSLKPKDNTANHTQGQKCSDRDLPHTASDLREMDKPAMACFGPIVCSCCHLNGNGRSRGNRNLLARGSNPSVAAARQG